jgi:CheY-like chemotaxis protein
MSNVDPITIILIEDDEGHARLIEKNLRRAGVTNRLVHFNNGRKALDYFFPQDGSIPQMPMLIVLDLNLPEIDGHAIIEQLKTHPTTQTIPVIVLTTTDNSKEVERCYAMGCNVYMVKPVDYKSFVESIQKLGLLLTIVKVPGETS